MGLRVELVHWLTPCVNDSLDHDITILYLNQKDTRTFRLRLYNFINPFWRETKCPKLNVLSKSFSATPTVTKMPCAIYTCVLSKMGLTRGWIKKNSSLVRIGNL